MLPNFLSFGKKQVSSGARMLKENSIFLLLTILYLSQISILSGIAIYPASAAQIGQPDPRSCGESGENLCVNRCERALDGFNSLFKAQSIDLEQIRNRALIVEECADLQKNEQVDEDTRRKIRFMLEKQYSVDANTAMGCSYAIRKSEAGGVPVGSAQYNQQFERVGCAKYARVQYEEEQNRRICILEKAEFETVIQSDDIAVLKAADSRLKCQEYRGELFKKFKPMEQQKQAAEHQEVANPTKADGADIGAKCSTLSQSWQHASLDELATYAALAKECGPVLTGADPEVASLLREVDACTNGLARMQATDALDASALQQIARDCPKLVKLASLRLQDIARDLKADVNRAEAVGCFEETVKAKDLVNRGTYKELATLMASSSCGEVTQSRTQMIADLCNRQEAGFKNHLLSSTDTPAGLKALYDCPRLAGAIDERFSKLAAGRQLASICEEDARLLDDRRDSYDDLTVLSHSLRCEAIRPLVASALSELCARETISLGRFADPGAGDLADYENALARAQCPSTQKAIATVIAAMRIGVACQSEGNALAQIRVDDLTGLVAFDSSHHCDRLDGEIARRVDQAKSILVCGDEQRSFDRTDKSDLDQLMGLKRSAKCALVASLVDREIVTLEQRTNRAKQKRQCEQDAARVEFLRSSRDLDGLRKFEGELQCDDMRADVAALITSFEATFASLGPGEGGVSTNGDSGDYNLPALTPEINLALPVPVPNAPAEEPLSGPDLYVELQTELQRLGCYSGAIDGKFGRGSNSAVENYQESYNNSSDARSADIELLNELRKRLVKVQCVPVVAKVDPQPSPPKRASPPKNAPRANQPAVSTKPSPPVNTPAPKVGLATTPKPRKVQIDGVGF